MRRQPKKIRKRPASETWFVYLLRCADGSLYTGTTKDVDRRCRQHNDGTASRYTRGRFLVPAAGRTACTHRRPSSLVL